MLANIKLRDSMTLLKIISIVFLLFLLNNCAGKSDYILLQSDKNISVVPAAVKDSYEYIILPQDRLKISIYRNPEFTATSYGGGGQLSQDIQSEGLLVDSYGYITLPLINRVRVTGLTQSEAAKFITKRYKKYLKIPTVYVEVLNKRVYVIGEVNRPGPVKLDKEKVTLLEALAFAGDVTDDAVRDNVLILSRNAQNKPYLRSVDLTNFDRLSMTNMILRPNDVVYVQPTGWKEYKVNSDNFTAPFKTITEVASPFVTLKYLTN